MQRQHSEHGVMFISANSLTISDIIANIRVKANRMEIEVD